MVKIKLFQSFCKSLTCDSLWHQYNDKSIKKLNMCHNDVFHYFLYLHLNSVHSLKLCWSQAHRASDVPFLYGEKLESCHCLSFFS